MFNKIRMFYDRNKQKIWKIVLISIMIFLLIRVANYFAREDRIAKQSENKMDSETIEELAINPVISGTEITEDKAIQNNDTLDKFIEFCNNGNVKSAYDMLSSDCKESVFNDELNNFVSGYYEIIFTETRTYSKENWISSESKTTYLVTYENDILAYGGNKSENTYDDYITLVEENSEIKLNILSYVGSENIKKSYDDDRININVISKKIYINYEIYNIKFTNKTNDNINLYDLKNSSRWYVEDNNSSKSLAEMSGILKKFLTIESKEEQQLNVKILKVYNPAKTIKSINFENINFGEDDNKTIIINF